MSRIKKVSGNNNTDDIEQKISDLVNTTRFRGNVMPDEAKQRELLAALRMNKVAHDRRKRVFWRRSLAAAFMVLLIACACFGIVTGAKYTSVGLVRMQMADTDEATIAEIMSEGFSYPAEFLNEISDPLLFQKYLSVKGDKLLGFRAFYVIGQHMELKISFSLNRKLMLQNTAVANGSCERREGYTIYKNRRYIDGIFYREECLIKYRGSTLVICSGKEGCVDRIVELIIS